MKLSLLTIAATVLATIAAPAIAEPLIPFPPGLVPTGCRIGGTVVSTFCKGFATGFPECETGVNYFVCLCAAGKNQKRRVMCAREHLDKPYGLLKGYCKK